MENIRLSQKYEITKADSEEWARYHAIYRLSKLNEWMSLSFESDINRYKNVDWCYWVLQNGKKVGGAFIKPNMIKCVFTIPPFDNEEELISNIVSYTESLSDNTKPITVNASDKNSYYCYEKLGFIFDKYEKIMVCPTNHFHVTWDEEYSIVFPKEDHIPEMAKLFHETYSNSTVPSIASQTYDFQIKSAQIYFKHSSYMKAPADWSTLVYDNKNNKLIGACTVSLVNELPYILDIVVHPAYQRKGLASKMIKRVLSLTHDQYPAIRLSVNTENSAEIFYKNLGFISLDETGTLIKN